MYASRQLFYRPVSVSGTLALRSSQIHCGISRNSCQLVASPVSPDREKMDYRVRVCLAVLILAAGGGDPSLGQEELAAGTDTDLIETLSVSRNPFLAQGQARHAHGLSIQHQLDGTQCGEQGQGEENSRVTLHAVHPK